MHNEMSIKKYFVGIDLHSAKFNCCFLTDSNEKTESEFPVSSEGIQNFLKYAGKQSIVMVEASTGSFEFVSRIKDHVKCVYVANPHKLKLISMVKKKTDKIDAEKLAIFLKMQIMSGEELIKPVYVPEESIRILRSCFSNYRSLTNIIVQIKNNIHSIFKQHLVNIPKNSLSAKTKREQYIDNYEFSETVKFQLKILFKQLKQTEENLSEIEDLIKLIGADYYKEIEILTSMKGISLIMSLALIADIASIDRFPNSKHLTSYLRSAPSVDSSGKVTKIGKTNKFGRKLSVSLITQSVLHFRNANVQLNNWYETKSKTKGRGKMRMAMMRKIFSQVYHMLSEQEYHWHRDEANHLRKMKEYDNFLKRNGILIKDAA